MPSDAVAAYRGSTLNCSSTKPLHEPLNNQPETTKMLPRRKPPKNLHTDEVQRIEGAMDIVLIRVYRTSSVAANGASSRRGRKATALYFTQKAAANSIPAPNSFNFTTR